MRRTPGQAYDHPDPAAAAQARSSAEDPFLNPSLECDLVMKGGVTSGIVYPQAIIELARTYRIRCVGGTSAGAIAAAVTAAAEYGRATGGFMKLSALSRRLGEGTFLRDLFQPSSATRPLMDVAFGVTEAVKARKAAGEPVRGLREYTRLLRDALRRHYATAHGEGARTGLAVGAVAGLVLALVAAVVFLLVTGLWSWWSVAALLVVFGVPLALAGRWLGGLASGVSGLATILLRRVPENMYGLCTGRRETQATAPGSPEVLTDWLSAQIDALSGTGPGAPPLTFGRLAEKGVTLRMVTSNLSQHQPYGLPFDDHHFIFREEEFERLFPKYVVDHLLRHAYESRRTVLPAGYHYLPEADALPVIVATRMSLSFPVLISAVPLYTIRRDAFERRAGNERLEVLESDLQQNWFSDGGISSNFPIHFFDAWLPQRPTFGIKLTSLPPDAFTRDETAFEHVSSAYMSASMQQVAPEATEAAPSPDEDVLVMQAPGEAADLAGAVYLPRANDPAFAEWVPMKSGDPTPSLPAFLWSIFATAQNYRDNTQSRLPSYRERIVEIRLSDDEGGLNLAMDRATIERVMEKGRLAGEELLHAFDFRHHQWVRFRVLMGQLEAELRELEALLTTDGFDVEGLIEAQLQHGPGDPRRFPYPRDAVWCRRAEERLAELRRVIAEWESPHFEAAAPRPTPVLRVTPDL